MKVRVHKILSQRGFGSRRGIETLIREGRLKVNGVKAVIGQLVSEKDRFKIDDKDTSMLEMSKIKISSAFPNMDSQLIYVYDFLKMWRFLISYNQETENTSKTTEINNSVGVMPEEAPEIIFQADEEMHSINDIDEDLNDNFEEFNESEY